MSFNPDISKQAQEGIFSKKNLNTSHPILYFKEIISTTSKGIGVIKKLNNVPPRKALLIIYKSFLRPNLDYGDILCQQPLNESINSKLESIQYNATSAITGVIKGTSRPKLYKI